MSSGFIPVGEEKLHFREWGRGSKLLLAFHGYGDDATVFHMLEPYLSESYTVICIDMPHHGESEWQAGKLSRDAFCAAIRKVMLLHNVEKVSVLGYSMGGRISLSIVEQMPEVIDKVVLLAPDGLAFNYYYHFFTQTSVGGKILNHMLDKPGGYLNTIEWLRKKNIMSLSRYKFAMHFLQEEESRRFLQKVWPNTSEFTPSQGRLKGAIKKFGIPVSVIMGAGDKIIPPKLARKFSAGLKTVKVYVLDKGHRVLDNETAQQIASLLL